MDDLIIDSRVMTGCLGKTAFETLKEAKTVLKRMAERGQLRHQGVHLGKMTAYKCSSCHGYHHHHREPKRKIPRSVRLMGFA